LWIWRIEGSINVRAADHPVRPMLERARALLDKR